MWLKRKRAEWRSQIVEKRVSGERMHFLRAQVAHTLEGIVRKVADEKVPPDILRREGDVSMRRIEEEWVPRDVLRREGNGSIRVRIEEDFDKWLSQRKRQWRKKRQRKFYTYREDALYIRRPAEKQVRGREERSDELR